MTYVPAGARYDRMQYRRSGRSGLEHALDGAPLPGPFSVERTGIEPVTSGLQSRRSPS